MPQLVFGGVRQEGAGQTGVMWIYLLNRGNEGSMSRRGGFVRGDISCG